MNFGIGNVKGAGGSGNSAPQQISFTRTFEATVGYAEELGFLANNPLPLPLEHTDEGDDYTIIITSNSSSLIQITHAYSYPSGNANLSTNRGDLGGRTWTLNSFSNVEWVKINDGESDKLFLHPMPSNSTYGIALSFSPKQKQNLSGSSQYARLKGSIDLVLWDTELSQYEIYQTGAIDTYGGSNIGNNAYARGGNITIYLPKKYLVAGIKVNYLYYPDFNAPSE